MAHLGGTTLFLGSDVGWGKRESAADFAPRAEPVRRRRSSAARTATPGIDELADYCTCPVINGLTDSAHPCQALADLFTLDEIHGPLAGKRLAYVGDANNVARSLAVGCGKLGVRVRHRLARRSTSSTGRFSSSWPREVPDVKLLQTADPREAVRGAVGVYTDVWTSMGQEAETETSASRPSPTTR